VPNFGQDKDVKTTLKNIADAEKKLGKKLSTPKRDGDGSFSVPIEKNKSYNYKNLQLDSDIVMESDPICSSAGCTQYLHPKKKLTYELDYPVPNFGPDPDMVTTMKSLDIAEKNLKHKWVFGTKESKKKWANPALDTLYDDAPELDGDIQDSQKNLKASEDKLGHQYELVQTESDPICSSAGCTQYKHPNNKLPYPIDYPVPNLGQDADIIDNSKNTDLAEKMVGHKWVWQKAPKKQDEVVFETDKPLDADIQASLENLNTQETKLGKWDLPQEE
jgi:hypothetical protein